MSSYSYPSSIIESLTGSDIGCDIDPSSIAPIVPPNAIEITNTSNVPIPILANPTPPLTNTASNFCTHLIDDKVWNSRIQDVGCVKDKLPSKTYLRGQIPPIGPEGDELYYYHLSCIAIDFIKIFLKQQELKLRRARVPKNKTDIKNRSSPEF